MARMGPILETAFCLARPKTDVSINRLPETSRVKIGGVDEGKRRFEGREKENNFRRSCYRFRFFAWRDAALLILTILYSIALTQLLEISAVEEK